jgi:hypothetical protein
MEQSSHVCCQNNFLISDKNDSKIFLHRVQCKICSVVVAILDFQSTQKNSSGGLKVTTLYMLQNIEN